MNQSPKPPAGLEGKRAAASRRGCPRLALFIVIASTSAVWTTWTATALAEPARERLRPGTDFRRPSVEQFLAPDGRFDLQAARRSGYHGGLDLGGFTGHIDGRGGGLAFIASDEHPSAATHPNPVSSPDDFKWNATFGRPGFDDRVTAVAVFDTSLVPEQA